MSLPKFSNTAALRQSYQVQFGGLNHTKGATDGEIYDMRNMTSDHYPVLSPRGRRRTVATYDTIYGLYCYGEYTFIAAEKDGDCGLYINGDKVMALEPSEKQMEVCNKKLIIYPDKVYYDLNALDAKGVVADENALPADGNSYGDVYIVEYVIGADLYYWNNTEWVKLGPLGSGMSSAFSGNVKFIKYGKSFPKEETKNTDRKKEYDTEEEVINYETDNTIKSLTEIDFADYFRAGDAVTITGAERVPANNKTAIIREVAGDTLYFYENIFQMAAWRYMCSTHSSLVGEEAPEIPMYYYFFAEEGWHRFTISDLFDQEFYGPVGEATPLLYIPNDNDVWVVKFRIYDTSTRPVTATDYEMPVYDVAEGDVPKEAEILTFVAETADTEETITIERVIPDFDFILSVNNRLWGAKGDTVWGSKLGDPLNWNYFDGISIDSYSVELGTAGDVTGIANYNGYPTFFKEDGIYKLYGAYPSAYQVYATATNGVKKGCGKSIAKIGDALFYVSKAGVMMYGGGIPSYIGNDLGVRIGTAVGGTDGRKYYLCADGLLYVFDSYMNLWHIEDELDAVAMSYGQELLCGADGEVFTLGHTDAPEESDIDWFVQFADAVVGSPNKKGVEKVLVRADCSGGGYCDVYISFDGGEYEKIRRIDKDTKASTILPIVLKRGDYFSLKLIGHGDVDIYSLSYSYYHGSEL